MYIKYFNNLLLNACILKQDTHFSKISSYMKYLRHS